MADTSLSTTEFASAVTAITSAFGDPTRREIYLYARSEADGVTATQVAQRFDLHPNVARHHLDKLTGGGHLAVSTDRTTRAGRPSKRYHPPNRQAPLQLQLHHDDLLASLLSRAVAMLDPQAASEMAEQVGIEYGTAMAAALDPSETVRSLRTAVRAVADALTAHGFAAHAEQAGDELRIVSEHCPFGAAAVENPVICAVDRGIVKGMLSRLHSDTSPATTASVARGDAVCITAIGC